ncbi:MAG: DUF362 domain-containing protein [Lentimonas sp.]
MLRFAKILSVSLSFTENGCQVDSLARSLFGSVILTFLLGTQIASGENLLPRPPLGLVWEAELADDALYYAEVEALLNEYEKEVGVRLTPGGRGKVGVKVNTRGGRGLSTPKQFLRALIEALEVRGFARTSIYLIDYAGRQLRQAGIMPPLSEAHASFDGCPVIALDTGVHYDSEWSYDSPLPPAVQQELQLFGDTIGRRDLKEGDEARKSFLPAPLLFEVDFWINCAVGVDDPALGIDGALANATLWNVSNSQRFLVNQATASAAVAEIAAIPELEERAILHFITLERYQFIAGPFFNSMYSRSEPKLWMSGDPVALDRLLYDYFNARRLLEGFPEIDPLPRQLPFAASLGLGVFEKSRIRMESVQTVATPQPATVEIIIEDSKNTLN